MTNRDYLTILKVAKYKDLLSSVCTLFVLHILIGS